MFLQHLSRLFAFRQPPYILYLLLGLYIGMIGYAVSFLYIKFEEQSAANQIQVSQVSSQLSDRFVKLVYEADALESKTWLDTVHSMMTRKAKAKFDQIFLSSGAEIYQNGKIALVPSLLATGPNVSNAPTQEILIKERVARISRKVLLMAVSKNNMPCNEFTLNLVVKKKHGKILITDINVSDAQDKTSYRQFLSNANMVENLEQFVKNRVAAAYYAPDYRSGAPRVSSNLDCATMALSLNPRFTLARLQRVKLYIHNGKFDLAEKDLLEARKYSSGSLCERLLKDYTHSLQMLRKGQLSTKN